jgi:hypothetical protein
MSSFTPKDANVYESRWTFQTPVHAQTFTPKSPFIGSFNVPLARERPQPNNFQWMLYRPQAHAIPDFSYFVATRNVFRRQ